MDTEFEPRLGVWERHGQTLLLGVITAVLAFAAKALWDGSTAQATAAIEIKNLSLQIAKLEGTVQAMQSNFVTRGEFAVHETRIQSLESRRAKQP
jgi:hypothetical protein